MDFPPVLSTGKAAAWDMPFVIEIGLKILNTSGRECSKEPKNSTGFGHIIGMLADGPILDGT
jgi:hypothetical protein